MSMQLPTFEDPALKNAVRRVWGGQTAPQELHRRVREAAAAQAAPLQERKVAAPRQVEPPEVAEARRRVYRGFAIAAGIVLAMGISITIMKRQTPPPGTPIQLAGELPASLVARHDECSKAPDHHAAGLPRDDFSAIAAALHGKTGHAVLSESVGQDWQFLGASPCPVNNVLSGHLLFAKGDARLSLLSLPASVLSRVAPQSPYNGEDKEHALAGFVQNDVFVCLVESGPKASSDVTQVQALRDKLRSEATVAVATGHQLKPVDFAVMLAKCLP